MGPPVSGYLCCVCLAFSQLKHINTVEKLIQLPSVKLSNGLVVANYSSPHAFTFIDGNILEACSEERAAATMLQKHKSNQKVFEFDNKIMIIKHQVRYSLTQFVADDIRQIMKVYDAGELPWHVIIAPLPVLQGMLTAGYDILKTPFVTGTLIESPDGRVKKILYSDEFCYMGIN